MKINDETLRELQSPKSLILEIIERLTKAETRLVSIETQLESKVNKSDLAVFRHEMKTDFKDIESKQLKWLIGTILACFVVLGAFLKYF